MKGKALLAMGGIVIVLLALFSFHGESAVASNTTVVLYNSAKVGVVQKVREVELKEGLNEVPLDELIGLSVAETTVMPLDEGVSVLGIFSRNPGNNIYEANVGKEIEVKLRSGDLIKGKFLGIRDGKIAIEGDGYYLINPSDVAYFRVKNIQKRGSVYAVLKAERAGKYRISLIYRVPNMSWESRYRLYIGNGAKLYGYVVVENPTSQEFRGAKVLLVAGDVRLYQFPPVYTVKAGTAEGVQPGQPEKVEAFYLYRLGIVDINPSSTSVYPYISLTAPLEREYLYESWPYTGSGPVYESVSFKTDEVIPAGVVEIYRETGDGPLLIGESRIEHTPKGGTVRIGIGRDYDIKGTTTVLEQRTGKDYSYFKIRITIQNFGNETKTVIVRHHKRGKMISSTLEPVEETADYVEFRVTVKPGERKEIVFDYSSSS